MWREAETRVERAPSGAAHTFRFAVVMLVVCALAAAFVALLRPTTPTAAEQIPQIPPVATPAPATKTAPDIVMAENKASQEPAPQANRVRATNSNGGGQCLSCPTQRRTPRTAKPDRRPRTDQMAAPETESCADC